MPDRIAISRPPTNEPSGQELVNWLALSRRLAAAAGAIRERLAGHEQYSETEQLVLWHCSLGPAEGLGQSQLVLAIGCSPAQISGTVENLRKAGQLRARRATNDRRRQLWSLTTAGTRTLAEWQIALSSALAELSAQLPAESLARMGSLLARLETNPAAPFAGQTPPEKREAA